MVSISRLARNDVVWKQRHNFLQGKSFIYKIPCMVSEYNPHPLRFFLHLESEFPRLYRRLEDSLNRRLGGQRRGSLFDALLVLCSRLVKIPGVCYVPPNMRMKIFSSLWRKSLHPMGAISKTQWTGSLNMYGISK